MTESNNIQVLAKVSTEFDESQTRLNLVNLCIKAQQELAHKLRKEAQRRKDICNFIRNSNLQLEIEIKNAEQEIKSSLSAYETIRSANVELQKELLLVRKSNSENIEHMKKREKKYEDLWLECKTRYESIPFVKKWMQTEKKSEALKENIIILDKEAEKLKNDIITKRNVVMELEKKQIIEMANFLVHELPVNLAVIQEKSRRIAEIRKDIENMAKEQIDQPRIKDFISSKPILIPQTLEEIRATDKFDENWSEMKNDDILMMPKLKLVSSEFDVLSVKLELKKNVSTSHIKPVKRTDNGTDFERNTIKRPKIDDKLDNDYVSSYFNVGKALDAVENNKLENKVANYSERKLIHILEDIRLDVNETYDIVAKTNPDKFEEVSEIGKNIIKNNEFNVTTKQKKCEPLESEEIEEIDLTKPTSENILNPPTQFLDLTQDKRRESFGDPMTTQVVTDEIVAQDIDMSIGNEICNETINSQIEEETDQNYAMIKNMILKKHNLDLSPQFIYGKNSNLQKRNDEEKIVTSDFFDKTEVTGLDSNQPTSAIVNTEIKAAKVIEINDNEHHSQYAKIDINPKETTTVVDADEPDIDPKATDSEKPVIGFLFSHGPQGLPESLDISMSTNGFEEGDGEFSHCLDSSLLLSPKADLPLPLTGNNTDGGSQEVPNFLSGFRRAGLSFFGNVPATNSKPDSSVKNEENNFNFNFGQEKKNKGGLFSFFR